MTDGEFPPLASLAPMLVLVGLLFLLRYGLVTWRLKRRGGTAAAAGGAALQDAGGAERRYARRQLWIGVPLLVAGLLVYGWLLASALV
ncbi:hypothetical protein NPA31_005360 [Aurantimonas sp. MSK8Z-1]|uniref:hypothetical protein n=1 Tax=Mangrovibrevibacter kandeliae TaxID=2968473 RepID=UPI002118ECAF|nr:hypothetical protein [Aurantimonas sp. MSK8Z-1]MCW4114389.1 hypothetical protein [Aurantimonas sp. MSK8Z-1]